jgi:hypothetical protein
MADNLQTTPSPAHPSPTPPTPTPTLDVEMDSLLSGITDFKGLFAESDESEKETPGQKESASETDGALSEGLAPALPLEEEAAPETEPELEEEPEPEREPPDAVQKRIDKLTAQRKTAEEKAAALEAELSDLKAKFVAPAPVAPTPASPLAHIETEKDLARQFELSRQAKTWAFQNLDGGNVDLGDGKTKFLDGDQVKLLLSRAEDMLTIHVPQRHAYLQEKAKFDAEAKKIYPTLFKPGHKDQLEYNSWLQVEPQFRKYPDVALIIGDAIVGRSIRLQKGKKAAVNGNGNTPLAAPAPAAQPRVPKNRTLSGEALTAIATDPSSGALDRFVDQLMDAARAQRSK